METGRSNSRIAKTTAVLLPPPPSDLSRSDTLSKYRYDDSGQNSVFGSEASSGVNNVSLGSYEKVDTM